MPFTPIYSTILQASEFTRFPHKFPPLKTIPLLPALNPLGPRLIIKLVDDTAGKLLRPPRVCRRTKLAVAKPTPFPGVGAMAFTLYPTKSSTRAPWSTSFFRHKFPAAATSF
jgi:hypothetical protein